MTLHSLNNVIQRSGFGRTWRRLYPGSRSCPSRQTL